MVTPAPAIGKARYLPVREMICPEPIDTTSSPAIRGKSSTPDAVGDRPLTTWKNARQIGNGAEHGEPDNEPDNAGHGERTVPEQVQGQYGFRRVPLDQGEHPDQSEPGHAQGDYRRRPPLIGGPAQAREQHKRAGRHREGYRPQVVDDVMDLTQVAGDLAGHDEEGHRADGDVDVEDPAPGEVVDEHAAEQRADDAGETEDSAEKTHVLAPLPGRDDVSDDGLSAHHEAAAPKALDGPEHDQLDQCVAQAGKDRPDEENDDGGLEKYLPAVLVPELAP